MNYIAYRKYMCCILLLILAFNYEDRLALGIMLQDVKTDLAASDSQLGLLSGLAFALFYSVMGIPIALWADRGNRVNIIAVTAVLWSIMVALCGVARTFTQLLLLRIGVAIGEAGCIPPAHSLIADHFTRAERPRATATYMLGSSLSVVIGYFVAGALNQVYGWRRTFMLLGAPGFVLAVLAWVSLKEPRLTGAMPHGIDLAVGERLSPLRTVQSEHPSVRAVWWTLWNNVTFRHLLFFFSVVSFFTYGIVQWQPAFFIRSYGMNSGQLGAWLAAVAGIGGLTGTYLGGAVATRRAANNERLQLMALSALYASFAVLSTFVYVSPNKYVAFGLLALLNLGGGIANGPLFGTIQTLVPERMRAMSISLLYLFGNLVGMGLGPLAAGILSDRFRSWAGEESLRYALLSLCPGYLWAAWHLWKASVTVTRDLAAVHALPDPGRTPPEAVAVLPHKHCGT